jgi:probable lipoprotein NlpC
MVKPPLWDKQFSLYCIWYILLFSPGLFAEPPLNADLDVNPRLKVLAAAEAYQGTPYKYAGVDRRGLDCSGLIYLSFRDALAVTIPRTSESLYAWSERMPGEEAQAGDLLFFKTSGNAISHVGIYAGDGRFIHSASSGPRTGVIYSYLYEDYWRRNFVGAGRVLPADKALPFSDPLNPGGGLTVNEGAGAGGDRTGGREPAAGGGQDREPKADGRQDREPKAGGRQDRAEEKAPKEGGSSPVSSLLGMGIALSWGAVPGRSFPVRGTEFQFRFAWDIPLGKFHFSPGLELRPGWDSLLGVFRFPLTLSLGWGDLIRVFFGPALTLGAPLMPDSGEGRQYTGGNSWLGIVGITVAPFSVKAGNGILSPYGELVWQSFFRDPAFSADTTADVKAALKFSTGLRYTWIL